MNKIALILLSLIIFPNLALAQTNEAFYKAKVVQIVEEGENIQEGFQEFYQTLEIEVLNQDKKGELIQIENRERLDLRDNKELEVGDKIIINSLDDQYILVDKYRLPAILNAVALFAIIAIIFGGMQGVRSFISLGVTVLALTKFIIPLIVAGSDPLLICLAGAIIIAATSIFIAHGVNRRIMVAFGGIMITLLISTGLAALFVKWSSLFGLGSDEAYSLQIGAFGSLDFRGLLLGGIILGTLGILDDVATGQAAAVDELKKANSKYKFKELYQSAISIGKEHIAALINTLFLAYAGASLPLLLVFAMDNNPPLWAILNDSYLAEEIIRTIVGSTALILAVPITTAIAAYYFQNHKATDLPKHSCGHVHH